MSHFTRLKPNYSHMILSNGRLQSKGFEEQNYTVRWSIKQLHMSKAVKRYSGNSNQCFANFTIQLIHSSPCCLLLCFPLSGLLHPSCYWIQVCSSVYSGIEHANLVCVCVFITGCISISKHLS